MNSKTTESSILLTVIIFAVFLGTNCQIDNSSSYQGMLIGALNSYDHNVSGVIYQIDQKTLLLSDFNYDGKGEDTFFWAGGASKPGSRGFIIPDEFGTTNVLGSYVSRDINVTLPGTYEVDEIKWFSVYDLNSHTSFGEIYMPTYSTTRKPYEK